MIHPTMMAIFLPNRSESHGTMGMEATLPIEYIAVRRPREEPVGLSKVCCQEGMIWRELNMALMGVCISREVTSCCESG